MSDEAVKLKIPGIIEERLIRRGDHAELYQGVQEQFQRKVAIKLYTGAGVKDAALKQFETECAAMGDLSSHPYIVTYFKSGHQKRKPYVVSEWLDDGTLADRLEKEGQLDWRTVVDIGVKLCGSLETAHRAGILHRKIKPDDVFVSPFGEPLLGDFKLDPTEESRSGDPYEALLHAAPELFRGGESDTRSDVYALASLLYTLILGRSPFMEEADEPLMRIKGRALAEPATPLVDLGCPEVVQTVLRWGLRPDPTQRPARAQELGRALQAAQTATGEPQSRLQIRPRTDEDRALPVPSIPAAALSDLVAAEAVAAVPEEVLNQPITAEEAAQAVAPAPPPPAAAVPPPPAAAPAAAPAADAGPESFPAPTGAPVSVPPPPGAAPTAAPPAAAPAQAPAAAQAPPVTAPAPAATPIAAVAAPTAAFSPAALLEDVRRLVQQAHRAYTGTVDADKIAQIDNRLDEPLRVAIAGKVKAGKSTLLNGLVGEELAPTDAGECTKVVTWYTDGITYRAMLHQRGAEPVPTRFSRESGALDIDLGGRDAESIERIVVEWPSSALSEMSLIDTPGIASISSDVSNRTHRFLTATDEDDGQADAVIYLMRHFHPTDVRFLESFHDDELARPNPINAIGVLSRADELSGDTSNAMETADRVAKRYRDDPQIRRLCQTVVPVAGLLAQAGPSLRQSEYNLLERLSHLDDRELSVLLASVDRFTDGDLVGNVTAIDREHLLKRLGLYGVAHAIRLIREGKVDGSPGLAKEFIEHSGLLKLRETLMSQFAARRDVLKARAALHALEQLVRQSPPPGDGAGPLLFEAERIRTGAHVFAEIQLFSAHRAGTVTFRDDEVEEVERLLGTAGFASTARLGLPPDAGADDIRPALIEAARRWKTRAENPLTPREVADAARVLVRTCEGMLVGLH